MPGQPRYIGATPTEDRVMSQANNPHPTKQRLNMEEAAEALVIRQLAGNAAFLAAVAAFVEAVKDCDWPLGCPVDAYDRGLQGR